MKNTFFSLVSPVNRLPRRKTLEAALLAIMASLAAGDLAQAASATWSGATDGSFATGSNWLGGSAPGLVNSGSTNTSDTATFNSGTNTTINVDSGRNIGAIVFDLSTAGAFVLNGGPLWLTATNPSITINNSVINNQTINTNLNTTRGGYNFTNNSQTAYFLINGSVTGASGSNNTLTLSGTTNSVSEIHGNIAAGASGTLSVAKGGGGTWILSGSNTYNGTTAIQAGAISVNSVANNLGTSSTAIDIGSSANGGTLIYTGGGETVSRAINMAGTTASATLNASGSGAISFITNFTATGVGSKTLILTGSNGGNNTISGSIVDNGGVNKTSLQKDGMGKWVLSGSNTYTGITRMLAGNLTLDFSASTAPTNDIINASSTLALGAVTAGVASSATLNIVGKNNAASSQSFTTSGTVVATIGAYHINLTPTGTGTVTLNLGTLPSTKSSGFSLDFGIPTGGIITTTTATTAAGVLPQGATVNGTDFATVTSGTVTAFTAYTANTGTALGTTNQVVDMSSGNTTITAASNTVAALRFNSNAARTVTLNTGTTLLTVNGGILVTGSVGSNASTITGGILQGVGGRDLLILQNNTSSGGALQIGSTIVQNTNGGQLTKSGLGDLILSGTSSYAGTNYINEGKIIVTSDVVAGQAKSGTSTAASAVLTGIDTTGLWIGQRVTGTALGGTSYYIAAINSGSGTVTLNTGAGVTAASMTFDMSGGSGLGSSTGTNAVQIASGAFLQIGNGGTTGNLLSNQGVQNNGTLTFNRTNAFTFSSTTFGTGSVVQAGSGTTTLAGVHSYTGATVVNAGTLLVAGSANSSAATVNSGGSLGGTGSVGSVTVNAGGAIKPGSGGIGTLSTNNGNLVWNGETSGTFGQMKFELSNVGNTSDVIALGVGMLDKNTGSVFSFDFQGTGLFNTTYTLITFGSTDFLASDFSYTNLGSGLTGTFAVNAGSLQFTTVPEPSVVVLSGLGLALVLWRARRRVNAVS